MSLTKVPVTSTVSKQASKKMKNILPVSSFGEEKANQYLSTELPELREKSNALGRKQLSPSTSESDFIPEEILSALTSAANAANHPSSFIAAKKSQTTPNIQRGVRSTNQLWHHPIRRNKFKHLTEQPICLTGAGRDISFLCDVYMMGKKTSIPRSVGSDHSISKAQSNTQLSTEELDLQKSLIPEEFHIIKNKGVLGLEYYEDKYTTLLEDSEKKLRIFPSMKPNGRSEVIQLGKVMDSMLKKAKVDEESLQTSGPTQMHNMLELLKKEQNIYNIVFHELIRQVSVDCAERGELLAKLRQQYVNLLDRIPRQMKSLHNSMMAQRALDRRLTDELIQFKNSIELLMSELFQVQEHDQKVIKDAKYTKTQLARALKETQEKTNMLEEYRELYELQRRRLEINLGYLTEERDLWSSTTYKLAEKVIERNKLQLVHTLYLHEKSWNQVVRHFLVVLATTDTSDLAEIQQVTETWRKSMVHFGEQLEHVEESRKEKLRHCKTGLEEWHQYFKTKVFVDHTFRGVPRDEINQILNDLISWEKMIIEELEQFAGAMLLANKETLDRTTYMQQKWTELGQRILERHQNPAGETPELDKMKDVNRNVTKLTQQYTRRMEGENGVASALMSLFKSFEPLSSSLQAEKNKSTKMQESDWLIFSLLLPEWMDHVDSLLKLTDTSHSEASLNQEKPHAQLTPRDVFKKLQKWILAMTAETEKDDIYLTQDLNNMHKAMVQWMVDLLMILTSKNSSEVSEDTTTSEFPEEEETSQTIKTKLVEDAEQLARKLNKFSLLISSCCKTIVEDLSQKTDVDPDFELKSLETVKTKCMEWIETCNFILSDITGDAVSLKLENQIDLDNTELKSSIQEKKQSSFKKHSKSHDKTEPDDFTAEDSCTSTSKSSLPNVTHRLNYDFMKIIGHDANIFQKSIKCTVSVSKPQTAKAYEAFNSLVSLDNLQHQLLLTELRAQRAEEITANLNEQLKIAQERLLELEQKLENQLVIIEEEPPPEEDLAESMVSKMGSQLKKAFKSKKSKFP
uniref:Axonemal dynein light chain domain-containing protein 1 isoform X2 n=1 Tax=Geotrypetes seraphini TaxID=260995 RepID=A0A6P8N9F8_GEOSA|nr:axonemal dynein light chain domain-containing protein 1 isoform X2 [Geotrypetes seraphini]